MAVAPLLFAAAGVMAINALTAPKLLPSVAPVEDDGLIRKGVFGLAQPLGHTFVEPSVFIGDTPDEVSHWQRQLQKEQGKKVLDVVEKGDQGIPRIYRRGADRNALPVFQGIWPELFSQMQEAEADRTVQVGRKPNLNVNKPPRGGVFHTAVVDGVWGF